MSSLTRVIDKYANNHHLCEGNMLNTHKERNLQL